MTENTFSHEVIKNAEDLVIEIKINGGSDDPKYRFGEIKSVKSAINALQDLVLGVYACPKPGLHLYASKEAKALGSNMGYVGRFYDGKAVKTPTAWTPVSQIGESFSLVHWGKGYGGSHYLNAQRLHEAIELIVSGVGISLLTNKLSRPYVDAALKKIAENNVTQRTMDIDSALNEDKVYARTKGTLAEIKKAPPKTLIVQGTSVPVDMMEQAPGYRPFLVSKTGKTLKSRAWFAKPEDIAFYRDISEKGFYMIDNG